MDGLIQTTTGVKSGLDRPRFWDFGGEGRSIEIAIAARIFEVSGRTLFCSLAIVIYRHAFAFIMDGWAHSDHNWHESPLYRPRFGILGVG